MNKAHKSYTTYYMIYFLFQIFFITTIMYLLCNVPKCVVFFLIFRSSVLIFLLHCISRPSNWNACTSVIFFKNLNIYIGSPHFTRFHFTRFTLYTGFIIVSNKFTLCSALHDFLTLHYRTGANRTAPF